MGTQAFAPEQESDRYKWWEKKLKPKKPEQTPRNIGLQPDLFFTVSPLSAAATAAATRTPYHSVIFQLICRRVSSLVPLKKDDGETI